MFFVGLLDRLAGPRIQPEDQPVARAVAAMAAIVIFVCLLSFALAEYWHEPEVATATMLALPVTAAAVVALRRGHRQLAGGVIIVTAVALITVGATFGQGIHDYSMMAFPAVVFFSSLLGRGQRTYIAASALSLAALAWLVIGEAFGIFTPRSTVLAGWPDALLIMTLMMAGVAAMHIVWVTVRGRLENVQRQLVERQQAESALRDSETRYRALFEHAGDYVLVTEIGPDLVPRIVDANGPAVAAHGYTREEMIGQPITMLDSELSASVNAERARQLDAGVPTLFQARHRRKDGSEFDVEVVATPVEIGGRRLILAVERDVTARNRAEAVLRDSEQRLRAAQELANVGYWVMDHETGVVTWSPTLYRIYGFDPAGPPPDWPTFRSLVHPDDQAGVAERFEQALARREDSYLKEYRVIRKDGSVRYVRVQYQTDRDPATDHWRTFGTDQDITDLRQTEEERQHLANQLFQAQKLESIGTLAAGIAHDFNNILNIIVGNADLLAWDPAHTRETAERVGSIKTASERGAQLVRQLLTIARKTETNRAGVKVNDLVVEFARLIQETFPKTIEVSLGLDFSIPTVLADAAQLHQVLLNLCVNARDAMGGGPGTLALSTRVLPGAAVKARHLDAKAAEYVGIDIRDSGSGMDEATVASIFDPFFTTKPVGKGTGLGLSVVRSIIVAHEGYIDVTTQPGAGTAFHILLPAVASADVPSLPQVQTLADVTGGTETILVIEDEDTARRLVAAVLNRKGYRVLSAADGAAGVDMFAAHQDEIALVLSDHGLPVFNGEEVYRRIRRLNADVPFILMTGFLEPESHSRFLAMAVADVVFKPFSAPNLVLTIRRIIDQRAAGLKAAPLGVLPPSR